MKEFLSQWSQWKSEGKSFVVARVISTWGSSPRPVGSVMLISESMETHGSVSGGCVEGAVLKEAKGLFRTNKGKLLSFGVSDDEAWAVGLTCGGKLQVYLQAFPPQFRNIAWEDLMAALSENKNGALITKLSEEGGDTWLGGEGTLQGVDVSEKLLTLAKEALNNKSHELIPEDSYFIQVFPKRKKLLIIGAAHITVDLVAMAKPFDWETIIIDPRNIFADNNRFSIPPDSILRKYPSEVLPSMDLDNQTYAVILSHDPKIDDDALQILLRSQVAYIGALGSKKTHEKRVGRLIKAGFTQADIDKIKSPIGVDIQATGAREIALSILSELIKVKNSLTQQ